MDKDMSTTGDAIAYMLWVCAIAAVIFGATGCFSGTQAALNLPADGVAVIASAEGMRALGDVQNGIITNTKASADVKSAYWIAREQKEVQNTFRDTASGFWGKLVESFKGSPQQPQQ